MTKEVKNAIILKIGLIVVAVCGWFWGMLNLSFNFFFSGFLRLAGSPDLAAQFGLTFPILTIWVSGLLGLGSLLSLFFPRHLKAIVISMLLILFGKIVYIEIDPEQRAKEAKIKQEKKEELNYHQNIAPWVEELKNYKEAVKLAVETGNPEKIKIAQSSCEKYIKTMPAATLDYANKEDIVNSCHATQK